MGVLIIIGKILVLLGMISVAFFLFIPKALQFFSAWKKTNHPRDFSLFVNCWIWFLFFSLFVYFVAIKESLRMSDLFVIGIENLIVSILFVSLSVYFLIPKMLFYFQKWKETKKSIYFSMSIFFAYVVFCFMTYIFLIYLPKVY